MILAQLRHHWPTRQLEWMFGVMTFGTGVAYTLEPDLFHRPWYNTMQDLMPQPYWALLCLIIGGARLVFLLVNGSFKASPSIRCIGAAANCGLWVAFTIAVLLNGYDANVLAFFPVFLVFDLLVVRSLAVEWGAASRDRSVTAKSGDSDDAITGR